MKIFAKTIILNFIRNPVTNLINLLGLAVSMTLIIILSIYCYSELCTDNFHVNGKRVYLYRLSEDRIYTPGILKENIDMSIPDVAATVRISGTWEAPVFQVYNREPFISDLIYADEDFFKLFTYNFIEGTPETALQEPIAVVITETLISCLGILAMSLFVCQRRVKEIGIRKVNGAKVSEILAMLNKDFVKWVVIAFVISVPVAWYLMYKWLQNFAFKTELSLWIFALTGLMVLGIALLTVSWQSWHSATRNPVEALRYE